MKTHRSAGDTPVRPDHALIEGWIEPQARVLDLGCGDGALLARLMKAKQVIGRGVEIDAGRVRACVARGVPVYHGDMVEGLALFRDGSFDYVVLSQTLQEVAQPGLVLNEMLRVGRKAIVSFPNYGYWRLRLQSLFSGRSPRSRICPYRWCESPGIHLLSVKDFREFCERDGIRIQEGVFLSTSYGRLPRWGANLTAALAIFLLARSEGRDARKRIR